MANGIHDSDKVVCLWFDLHICIMHFIYLFSFLSQWASFKMATRSLSIEAKLLLVSPIYHWHEISASYNCF